MAEEPNNSIREGMYLKSTLPLYVSVLLLHESREAASIDM